MQLFVNVYSRPFRACAEFTEVGFRGEAICLYSFNGIASEDLAMTGHGRSFKRPRLK
jgi:hypothetical protein